MENKETLEEVKDLAYYKTNEEEDYLQVPISVLRYISQLEQDKNKYSEEDIKSAYNEGAFAQLRYRDGEKWVDSNEWFEEFKKK
jgi:hypothetical protein